MKPKSTLRSFLILAGSMLLATSCIQAADGTWNGISGNWSDTTDPGGVWSGGIVADDVDFTANFTGVDITVAQTITLDSARTIGNITFTDDTTSSHNLTISGANILTLDRTVDVPVIDVTQAGRTVTISSQISGNDGLQKNGGGNLTLSGANDYSGQTILSAGTLQGTTASTSLTPTSPFGASALVLNGGILQLRASGTLNTTAETITIGNNTTVGGTTTIDVNRPGATSTTKTIALGTLDIGANTLNVTGGNSYLLSFGATTLTGNANFSHTTVPLRLGVVSETGGARSLTKSGSGTLTLTGSSSYSGGTFINGGILSISSNGNLGDAAGGVTFSGNSTLTIAGTTTSARQITLDPGVTAIFTGGGAAYTNSGKVTGAGNISFTVGGGTSRSFAFNSTSNDFTGAISLDGNASGQSNSATFNSLVDSASPGAGNISIGSNASGVSAGASVVFSYGSGATGPLTLDNRQIRLIGNGSNLNGTGATFSNLSTTQAVTINTDLLASGANGKLTLSAAAGPTNVFAGLIANGSSTGGGVIINKTGTGKWAFSGANTYTGSTIVSAGSLTINSISEPGSPSPIGAWSGISLSLTGGTLQYAPINAAGAAGHSTTRNFGLVANSSIDASGTGPLVFSAPSGGIVSPDSSGVSFTTTSGSRTVSGLASTANLAVGMKITGTGIAASSTILAINSATAISINNAATATGSPSDGAFGYGNRTLTLTGTNTGTNTIAGNLLDSSATGAGALSVTKAGAGTWVLSGANGYSGVTTVTGGALVLTSANALPGGIGNAGGTGALTINGGVLGLGDGDFTRNVGAINNVGTYYFNNNGGWAAYGADRLVNINGAGASYTWSLAFNGKSLILGASSATHKVTLVNPLSLNGASRTVQVDDGSAPVDAEFSGTISETTVNGLTKTGTGTLALSGSNSYTGTTTINAGTLIITGATQATSAITFGGGVLGLDIATPVTAANATINFTAQQVLVTGTPTLASYTLLTASSITGTPTLAAPVPGYVLFADGTTLKLNSTGAPAGYAAWQTANSTAGTRDQDHDNDGVDNGTEHFLGGDTNTTGFTPLPGVVNNAGTLSVTWVRHPNYPGFPGNYATDFVVETSTTLTGPWTPESSPGNVTITGNDVKYTFPGGPAYSGKNFARLKVTGP